MNKITKLHTLMPCFGSNIQKSLSVDNPKVVNFDHSLMNDPTTYLGYKIGQNPSLSATRSFITSFVEKAGYSIEEGQAIFQSLFAIYNSQGIGSQQLKANAVQIFTKDILGLDQELELNNKMDHKNRNSLGR